MQIGPKIPPGTLLAVVAQTQGHLEGVASRLDAQGFMLVLHQPGF